MTILRSIASQVQAHMDSLVAPVGIQAPAAADVAATMANLQAILSR